MDSVSVGRHGSPLDILILAAGRGSRLGPLGEQPKWLLHIGGRSIAEIQLNAIDRLGQVVGTRLRTVRVVTGHGASAVAAQVTDSRWQPLHNDRYDTLNNWYSVLLGLRSLPDRAGRVIVLNSDLCARAEWLTHLLLACADSPAEALVSVDCDRPLTEESMKVAARPDSPHELAAIGKRGVLNPIGEYVGLLMVSGSVLDRFSASLEAFERAPQHADEWYEGAVRDSAAAGASWALLPTPDTEWIEIDDPTDYERASIMFTCQR